jgi:hypothetical protein
MVNISRGSDNPVLIWNPSREPTTIEYYDVVNPDGTKTPKKVTRCSSRKHDMQDKGCEPKVEEV